MTPEELGSMAAAEMVVAHSPKLAARTLFRHQRDCPDRLRRFGDERDAFEQALREIAEADPMDLVLDPTWSQRIARAALDASGRTP